jgi:hypothetical protein
MTPLFSLPGGAEPDVIPGSGRRTRRAGTRSAGGAGKSGALKEPADLLAVTAERLRRALARSFLRYGIAGDLEAAVHAAMNVVEPVLEARDTEILRLRRLMAIKVPALVPAKAAAKSAAKVSAKVPAKARATLSAKVSGKVSG